MKVENIKKALNFLFYVSLILVSSFIIWPPAVQSIGVGVFLICLISKIEKIEIKSISFVFSIFFVFFYMLSFFWSEDKIRFFIDFQHIIGFLVGFILFFSNIKFKFKNVNKTLWLIYYFMSVSIFIYFLLWIRYTIIGFEQFYEYINNGYNFRGLDLLSKIEHILRFRLFVDIPISRVYQDAFYFKSYDKPLFFYHHTYLGTFLIGFLILSIKKYRDTLNSKLKSYMFFNIVFVLSWIFFIESTTSKLILICLSLFYVINFIYRNFKRHFLFLLVVSLLFFIFLFYKFIISNPYFIELEPHMVNDSLKYYVDYTRYELYKSIYLNIKSNFLFGVGAGDVLNSINLMLPEVHYAGSVLLSKNTNYNSHSMLFYFILSTGIIGFIPYLILNFKLILNCLLKNRVFYISIIISITMASLFENFFLRIWGVLIFNLFFFIGNLSNEDT